MTNREGYITSKIEIGGSSNVEHAEKIREGSMAASVDFTPGDYNIIFFYKEKPLLEIKRIVSGNELMLKIPVKEIASDADITEADKRYKILQDDLSDARVKFELGNEKYRTVTIPVKNNNCLTLFEDYLNAYNLVPDGSGGTIRIKYAMKASYEAFDGFVNGRGASEFIKANSTAKFAANLALTQLEEQSLRY